jgi:hypothetical protein
MLMTFAQTHPFSNDKLEEVKLKKQTPEGKLDKNGKALKFSRDLIGLDSQK